MLGLGLVTASRVAKARAWSDETVRWNFEDGAAGFRAVIPSRIVRKSVLSRALVRIVSQAMLGRSSRRKPLRGRKRLADPQTSTVRARPQLVATRSRDGVGATCKNAFHSSSQPFVERRASRCPTAEF